MAVALPRLQAETGVGNPQGAGKQNIHNTSEGSDEEVLHDRDLEEMRKRGEKESDLLLRRLLDHHLEKVVGIKINKVGDAEADQDSTKAGVEGGNT